MDKVFILLGIVVAFLVALFAFNDKWNSAKLPRTSAQVMQSAEPVRTGLPPAAPSKVEVAVELDERSYCEPEKAPQVSSEKPQSDFYPRQVAVASTAYRDELIRAAQERIAAIRAEDRKLGGAKFERVISAANHSEIARLQMETSYALR